LIYKDFSGNGQQNSESEHPQDGSLPVNHPIMMGAAQPTPALTFEMA